jgi:hypothetical protein
MRRDHQRRTRHHLAVDDGSDDRVLAREVKAEIAKQAPQGSRVRIRVSPLLGYVSNIEVLSPPARSAASEPGVVHPLIEETATAAGAKVATGLDGALARAASMTGEDGRPLLEQTDDEGVTLEQRLSEGRSQLDQLRRDPRVASSPLAGFLDALTGATPDTPTSTPTFDPPKAPTDDETRP